MSQLALSLDDKIFLGLTLALGITQEIEMKTCWSYFLGYKILILILVIFRVFWKISCRNEIQVFFGPAHFPSQVKMKSKLDKIVRQTVIRVFNLTDFLPTFLHKSMSFCRQLVHLPGMFALNPMFNCAQIWPSDSWTGNVALLGVLQ